MTNLLDNKTVRVLDVEIQGIEYKGQRVVTFKQIDEVHKRKEGTAKNSFYENKERFVESKHYFEIGRLEIPTDLWEAYGFNKFAPKGCSFKRHPCTNSGENLFIKHLRKAKS